jgi:hypothetical protein
VGVLLLLHMRLGAVAMQHAAAAEPSEHVGHSNGLLQEACLFEMLCA